MKKSFLFVFLIVLTTAVFAQSAGTLAPTGVPLLSSAPTETPPFSAPPTASPTPAPTDAGITLTPTDTTEDNNPPTTPQNLRVINILERIVYLAWDASTDDTGISYYQIHVTDPDGSFTLQEYTNLVELYMTAETTYTFKVQAVDTAGNASDWSNTVTLTTEAVVPPTVPQNLVVLSATESTITLSWDPSTDETGISMYYISYTGSDGSSGLWATSSIPCTIATLNPDTTYTLKVKATDMTGGSSEYSEPATGTTLAAPEGWTPYPTPTGFPMPTADPNNTTAPTTPPSIGCTCPNLCSSMTDIVIPFTKDGSGEYCYLATSLGSYINSWNCDAVNVNGIVCTNIYTSSSTITSVNGYYYIYYKASYTYSHMQIK